MATISNDIYLAPSSNDYGNIADSLVRLTGSSKFATVNIQEIQDVLDIVTFLNTKSQCDFDCAFSLLYALNNIAYKGKDAVSFALLNDPTNAKILLGKVIYKIEDAVGSM